MKTVFKKLAVATVFSLAAAMTAEAQPIVLPDQAAQTSQTGSFKVDAKGAVSLTGSPISFTTSIPHGKSNIAKGSVKFASGTVQYIDGTANLDGQMSRVSLGTLEQNGNVVYVLKCLVYGTLAKGATNIDVNGNLTLTTVPAPPGTKLEQAQVQSASVMLMPRSNINNTNPKPQKAAPKALKQ